MGVHSGAVAVLAGAFLAAAAGGQTLAQDAPAKDVAAIQADLQRIAGPGLGKGGELGVAAWRLEGAGPHVLVNGADRFPMASTFKVAVAATVLSRVDAGEVKLSDMVTIDPKRMVESEVLWDRFIHPGVSLSVYNLLELMLTQSDNTAADYMVEKAGGPAAVTAWLARHDIRGMRVDADTAGLLRRFFGIGPGDFPDALAAARKADPKLDARSLNPSPAFDDDPRDTSTPEAMADLLRLVFSGKALSPASTKVMIEVMQRCRTGGARLRGRMPEGTVIADKTGTVGGSVNDVGVVTLPDGAGQVIVAVFIKKSDAAYDLREKAIADVGRSVRDYFLYRPAP
jgi:beta-lactamase class A